jgi:hypothetical protein
VDNAVIFLVVYLPGRGCGSVSGVFSDECQANDYARSLGGVVLPLPITADYRRAREGRSAVNLSMPDRVNGS